MKTKIISMVVSLSVIIGILCVPASAANVFQSVQTHPVYSVDELAQIAEERQYLIDVLTKQLEVQDALDQLDDFMFLVDQTIQQKYYPNAGARATRYVATNGGFLYGTGTYVQIEAEFVTAKDAKKVYNARTLPEDKLKDVLNEVGMIFVGESDPFSLALEVSLFCQVVGEENMWKNINVGTDGVIFYGAYDTLDMRKTIVFWEWADYPYVYPSKYNIDNVSFVKK